ncbi:MAG: tetratricopeptide repeat protein [Chloroflexi bacterium]|nr:tetratricopeptide repeat protein [Chloroflexota bacterium]
MDHSSTFGQRLKHYRKALDLTQAELAQQVGCSVWTIVKIEADQRRPSRQIAERLALFLHIPPEQQRSFIQQARTPAQPIVAAPPADAPPSPSPTPAPALSQATNLLATLPPLIGRAQELEAAWNILCQADVRLLTFTGPPGIGKTLLALHIAQRALPHYADGVCFVPLAAVDDPALVIPTLARALGVRERGSPPLLTLIQGYVAEKQLLLLIDNFEHVSAAASALAELLSAAPRLNIVVTSRVALRSHQEYTFPVGPLSLPNLRSLPPLHVLATLPSIALFVARAQTIAPDFALTEANAAAVAAICVQLEGVPLAIDLAAARTRLLSPGAMLPRLRSRLALLTGAAWRLPARHRSLYATIDWSYELLTSGARTLFARLAVFVDGCTLEAIEAICGSEPRDPRADEAEPPIRAGSIMDQLDELLDHNLIWQEHAPDEERRFVMLEILREYAAEQLTLSGETEAVQRRHSDYYQALAETAAPELRGPRQVQWLDRLEREHGNLRAALRWSLERGQIALTAQLAGLLWRFWQRHGHRQEGRSWLEQTLAHGEALPPDLRAKVLNAAGVLAMEQGDNEVSQGFFEQALAIYRVIGDTWGSASMLGNLSIIVEKKGDLQQAIVLLEDSLALFRQLNDRWGIAMTDHLLGMVMRKTSALVQSRQFFEEALAIYRDLGDTGREAGLLQDLGELLLQQGSYAEAQSVCEASFALCRELGERRGMAYVLATLGQIALQQADLSQARSVFAESVRLFYEFGDSAGMVAGLEGLAQIAEAEGDALRQLQLRGAVAGIRRSINNRFSPEQPEVDGADRDKLLGAWSAGHTMTPDQIVEYVLEDSPALEWHALP